MELPVIPRVELPVMPEVELPVMPEVELPVMPEVELPVMPEVELPVIPFVELPVIPDVELPVIPVAERPFTLPRSRDDNPCFELAHGAATSKRLADGLRLGVAARPGALPATAVVAVPSSNAETLTIAASSVAR